MYVCKQKRLNSITKMIKKSDYNIFILAPLFLAVFSCARISAPTGGPKDNDPPVALKSKPINYATNFKGNKIVVLFDEYIVLKNVQQELLVSPPIEEKPEIKQRGKNLVININNELKDSTTYNFNFYNAVTDLNEGNLLPNFQFEFSTGPEFDSIYLGGILKNAFDYKTEEKLYVMAYDRFNDTIPRTTLPNSIAKTDAEGKFFITNLKDKPYFLFALKDMNNNMLFDLPNESIAFIDTCFHPGFKEMVFTDTIRKLDSLALLKKDTVFVDSLITHTEMVTNIGDVQLFMFTEDFEKQYFTNKLRPEKELVVFAFNRPLTDSLSIYPITEKPFRNDWFIQEYFEQKDSIVLWLTDSVLYNNDSLIFQLNYTMQDSNNVNYIQTDTVALEFDPEKSKDEKSKPKAKEKKSKRFNIGGLLNNKEDDTQKEDTVIPPSPLTFISNGKSPFELNKPLELEAKYPLANIDESRIEFYQIKDDTMRVPHKFKFSHSTTELRKYTFDFLREPEDKFEVLIPADVFTDIYGHTNDTLNYKFNIRELEFYSNIKLTLTHVAKKSVVQLMDEKEKVIEERSITGDTILVYNYLHPQKYIFKLFYDFNDNGKWDTGKLSELLQPETVFYFPQTVETKSNWDMEYVWDLYPVAPKPQLGKMILDYDKAEPINHENHDQNNTNENPEFGNPGGNTNKF